MNPKILFLDLETFPNKGFFWAGRMWETNIIKVTDYGGLASIAWSWDGQKKIDCVTREGHKNDRPIVEKLHELLDLSDAVVAHNGQAFDTKTSHTNILKYGMPPPSPYKVIDTKLILKKHFRFDSNSLDESASFLDVGRKLPHKGFTMWEQCMEDDPKAWREMRRYNIHDIVLLKGVFEKVRPWASLPNFALIADKPESCPKCLAEGTLQSRGFEYTKTATYRRFQCTACGGWSRSRQAEQQIKKVKVVG